MDNIDNIICKDVGSEFVLLAALGAISIGHNLSPYEQNLFGSFIEVVGENLCLMSIRKAKCKINLKNLTNTEKEYEINYDIINDIIR